MEKIKEFIEKCPDEWDGDVLHPEIEKVEMYPSVLGQSLFKEVWEDGNSYGYDSFWYVGETELQERDLKRLKSIDLGDTE